MPVMWNAKPASGKMRENAGLLTRKAAHQAEGARSRVNPIYPESRMWMELTEGWGENAHQDAITLSLGRHAVTRWGLWAPGFSFACTVLSTGRQSTSTGRLRSPNTPLAGNSVTRAPQGRSSAWDQLGTHTSHPARGSHRSSWPLSSEMASLLSEATHIPCSLTEVHVAVPRTRRLEAHKARSLW